MDTVVQMEIEQTLPDVLVERIILLLPFPSIAKARLLSKSWRARFSRVSPLDDDVTRRDVVTFQMRVQERAANWSTFFPMCLDNDFLCGYDRASQKWVSFSSLSFLPDAFRAASTYHWIEGALLYGMDWTNKNLYVANLLTRSWKRVDPPPATRRCFWKSPVSAWEASSETWKVIFLRAEGPFPLFNWCAQIYEPKLDVWSTKRINGDPALAHPVYLNGRLYMVANRQLDYLYLLALNMAEGTVEKLELSIDGDIEEMAYMFLVGCNGKLHMVVVEPGDPVCVLEIDLQSRRLFEVATAPISLSRGAAVMIHDEVQPVCDGNCIFFPTVSREGNVLRSRMVAYDVCTHEWAVLDFASKMSEAFKRKGSRHRDFASKMSEPFKRKGSRHGNLEWIPCSFQPGLNPFAEV